jgi:drug/metabolite transporter (DMT)-like permease
MVTDEPGKATAWKGILLCVAAVSLFGAVDGISKMLTADQSFEQIMLARYAFSVPFLLMTTRPQKWPGLLRTARPGLQILRGAAPLVIGGAMIVAVTYLPLAEATVILFAGPFLVVALSGPLLGEPVSRHSWIAVVVGFLGVLLVARPGFGELTRYTIFPAVGAVFYAVFQLMTRRLATAGEDPDVTLAWTLLVGWLVSVPLAIANWPPVGSAALGLALAMGVAFGLGQLFLARSFALAPAHLLAPLSYAQIIAATLFGLLVFGDVPDLFTAAGILLIIAAGVYVARRTPG